LRTFVQQTSCAPNGVGFADVNCDGAVTPGDARCIHANVVDGSCVFCNMSTGEAMARAVVPTVSAGGVWQVGDTLTVNLKVGGVPLLHAFGLMVDFAGTVSLIDFMPSGLTDFAASAFPYAAIAGGYALNGIAAEAPVDLLRMRFRVPDGIQVIYVNGFTDDLAGAQQLAIVWDGTPSGIADMPRELVLGQNHPNPFNPTTIIPYGVPRDGTAVRLLVFDPSGGLVRRLVDGEQAGGTHEAVWDGRDEQGTPVSSGVYFCVLESGGRRFTRKMVLLK